MAFEKGDFLLVEYTVRVKETGNVVDTTDPNLAKQENIYDELRVYGPTLIVLGKGWLNPFVEEELLKFSEGEEKTIEVTPDKAFGERDPGKVKIYSLREFAKRGYEVKVGDVVETESGRGIVKSISGGRVVVDFNHPLAGKILLYKVKVVKKLTDIREKLLYLAVRHLNIPSEELKVELDEASKRILVSIPGKYITRRELPYAKISLATDILDMFKDVVNEVVFQESIVRKTG
ncbi:FKBP-type peptidyl-prolyl cis-trans isomerase [Thermogladius sp. 4427co]|uniref:FKBP-type peptidyl-prolyl cis-trans isomerase n=1 Tax=Thermogladius sp. 4427co TaxID=3450718 RepID=UPI003F7922EA